MSRATFSLPIRALVSASRAPLAQQAERWTCRRCLATQALDTTTTSPPTPPMEISQTTATTTLPQETTYDPSLRSSERRYPLKDSDRLVKRPLNQTMPPSLLMHVNPEMLNGHEKTLAEKMFKHKEIIGVVVRTGRMDKTVSVRVPGRRWEPRIKKYFIHNKTHLVHDPNNSLTTGDVVSLHRHRASSAVYHVVASIVTPFGKPIEDRPPIPTPEERLAAYKTKRLAKLNRRSLRREAAKGSGEAIADLKQMGLDPGHNVKAGKGEKWGTEKGTGKQRTPSEGAILGKKGQKLPKGVLPGGKHEVGKIDERAKHNKESAMKMQEKAEENLAEAEVAGEELQRRGLKVGAKGEGQETGL